MVHDMANAMALSMGHTHEIGKRPGFQVVHESTRLGWRGLYAAVVNEQPWYGDLPQGRYLGIAYCLRHSTKVKRALAGQQVEGVLQPQQFSVLPAEASSAWEISGHPQMLHLYVHPGHMRQAALRLFGSAEVVPTVFPKFCASDGWMDAVASMAVTLLQEGRTGCSLQHAQVENLAAMLAGRLLTHHTEEGAVAALTLDSAMDESLQHWQHVLQAVDADLAGDWSVRRLAQMLAVDEVHLWRLFRTRLHTSPHQYVLGRRLEKAAQMLTSSNLPIAHVALEVGFGSQSHLGVAFKKYWGQTPLQYRQGRTR